MPGHEPNSKSTPFEKPVVVRFRFTVDEVFRAQSYAFRRKLRLFHIIFGTMILVGALSTAGTHVTGKPQVPLATGFLVGGGYWFFIAPFQRRWMTRRRFAKRPDKDIEAEWRFTPDQITETSALGHSDWSWQTFTRVVRTPKGLLFYPIDQMFHWVPRHAFESEVEYEQVSDFAKSKVQRFYNVG